MHGWRFEPQALDTAPLSMRGLAFIPSTISTAPLTMYGTGFEPRTLVTPMLLMRGQVHEPRSIHTGVLQIRGLAFDPRTVQTRPLNMRGWRFGPRILGAAPLEMTGLAFRPRTLFTEPLLMRGWSFDPRTIATSPMIMRGLGFDPRTMDSVPLEMRGLAHEPRTLFTPSLSMRGVRFEPRNLFTGQLTMRGTAANPRPIENDAGRIADNLAPGDIRDKITLAVPVRLDNLKPEVVRAKVACSLGNKHTGVGVREVDLMGNGLSAVVEVPVRYERDVSYEHAPDFQCRLLLLGPGSNGPIWQPPGLEHRIYRKYAWTWARSADDYRNQISGVVADTRREFPDAGSVRLLIDESLFFNGLGKNGQRPADAPTSRKPAGNDVDPGTDNPAPIHDFSLVQVLSLTGGALEQTDPFDFQDVADDVRLARNPDDGSGAAGGPVPLTLTTSLPVDVAIGPAVGIDYKGTNTLQAGGIYSLDSVALQTRWAGTADMTDWDSEIMWRIVDQSHPNPISDSVHPVFVLQRTAGGDFYQVTVGFDVDEWGNTHITHLSGFNCGADPGNCP